MAELTIRGLIERVLSGTIRIPKFQRAFVWEPEKVAFLMDSIYRGYPIGSVLLWRSEQKLVGERDLGPFELPEPEKQWPIDYVLDGQQRLTSLFGVFQNTLQPREATDSFNVYFDLEAPEGALEDQFIAYEGEEQDAQNLFPLRLLFDAPKFAAKTRTMPDDQLKRIVELQRRFQEFNIKSEVIEFREREQIAMIFERINRAGVPLDTFQLLTAWTWSDDFDLAEKIQQLGAEVGPFGYSRIGDEQDLLLKCCAAVVEGDASVKAIVSLHGPTVRDQFEKIRRGILGAIEFLRKEANVHSLEILPYPAMLVPLVRMFATDKASGFHPSARQRRTLVHWFWRNCLTRRYSSGINKAHAADIAWMDELKANEATPVAWDGVVDPWFFMNTFNIGTVATKVFVLLLATMKPRSLVSGAQVDLEDVLLRCNRNEFHHIYPKGFLQIDRKGREPFANWMNCLANFCFLSSADNQAIKDKAPKKYVQLIKKDRELLSEKAILPPNWWDKSFGEFICNRADMLALKGLALAGLKEHPEMRKMSIVYESTYKRR